jgi:uncharacterized protein with GYD domain
MATFIMLGHFSDQGIRSVKDTTKRVETVKAAAKKLGITVKDVYWTLGQYDTVLIAEAPDEATMTAFGLTVGAHGNVRTQTLRAFSAEEMGRIIGHIG